MLLIEKREKQKRNFVKSKMDTLSVMAKYSNASDRSTKLTVFQNLNAHFRAFTVFYNKARSEYTITNPNGNGCSFMLGQTYMSKYVDIFLFDLKYRYLLGNENNMPFFVYRLLEKFTEVEREYLQLIERLNKLEENANKIRKDISDLFQNSNYTYSLTETENKYILSVPVSKGIQLDIPVYYSKYEKTIPQIMSAVQMFEKTIGEVKIRVLVTEKKKSKS